jgi:ketosteroid isomerase-like protein
VIAAYVAGSMEDANDESEAVATVRRYLDTMVAHDWEGLAACLTPDVVRVGPYGDDYHGVDEYVAFLRATLLALDGYVMRVDRVVAGSVRSRGVVVFAELSETVSIDGAQLETPEALVFDLAPDGRIARVAIFLRTSFTVR